MGITFKEKPDKEEEEQEDENEKSLAWMSSEDEAIGNSMADWGNKILNNLMKLSKGSRRG